jgi:hypothetical protein
MTRPKATPDFDKCARCGADAEEFCSWDPADGWCCRNCGGCDSDE